MIDEQTTSSVRRKYNRNARWFDSMDRMMNEEYRRLVVGQATGKVLELGVGTGKNLPFYDPAITAELVAIDFSAGMLEQAKTKACRVPVSLLEMDAQRLAFPDGTFDTVVATCVFCTVPDPVLGLREAARVCKPGGQIRLLEHVRIDHPIKGPLMDLIDPLVAAMVGTHINRRTVENAARAGLHIDRVEPVKGDLIKLILAHGR